MCPAAAPVVQPPSFVLQIQPPTQGPMLLGKPLPMLQLFDRQHNSQVVLSHHNASVRLFNAYVVAFCAAASEGRRVG